MTLLLASLAFVFAIGQKIAQLRFERRNQVISHLEVRLASSFPCIAFALRLLDLRLQLRDLLGV